MYKDDTRTKEIGLFGRQVSTDICDRVKEFRIPLRRAMMQ